MSYYYYGRIKCNKDTYEKIKNDYNEISLNFNGKEYYIKDGKYTISFWSRGIDYKEDICPMLNKFHDIDLFYRDEDYCEEYHYHWKDNEIIKEVRRMEDGIKDSLIDYYFSDMQEIEYLMIFIDIHGNVVVDDFDKNINLNYKLTEESVKIIERAIDRHKRLLVIQPHIVVADSSDNIKIEFYYYDDHIRQIFTTDEKYAREYLNDHIVDIPEIYDDIVNTVNEEFVKNGIEYKLISSGKLKIIR